MIPRFIWINSVIYLIFLVIFNSIILKFFFKNVLINQIIILMLYKFKLMFLEFFKLIYDFFLIFFKRIFTGISQYFDDLIVKKILKNPQKFPNSCQSSRRWKSIIMRFLQNFPISFRFFPIYFPIFPTVEIIRKIRMKLQ